MTSVSMSASSAHLVNHAKEVTSSLTLVGSIQNFVMVPTLGLLRFVLGSCRRSVNNWRWASASEINFLCREIRCEEISLRG